MTSLSTSPQQTFSVSHPEITLCDEVQSELQERGISSVVQEDGKSASFSTKLCDEALTDAISYFPRQALEIFLHVGTSESSLDSIFKQALSLHRLREQAVVQEDGFYLPVQTRPLTWDLQEGIAVELTAVEALLRDRGIERVLLGIEFETTTSEYPVNSSEKWKEVKASSIADLSTQIDESEGAVREALLQKRATLAGFNAREVLLYDLLERDERTSGMFEPIFGNHRGSGSYYDGRNVLELQSKPFEPHRAVKNQRLFYQVLIEKASDYGLVIEPPRAQLNLSFWDQEGNIFDPNHSRFEERGVQIAAGMSKAIYENYPFFAHQYDIEEKALHGIEVGIDRTAYLRYSSGKVEVRPSGGGEGQHFDAMLLVCLAGAAYSLDDTNLKSLPNIETVEGGMFTATDNYKVISHLLSTSEITSTGDIVVPELYLRASIDEIADELGIIDDEYTKSLELHTIARITQGRPEFEDFVIDFFGRVHLSDEGNIVWPRDMDSIPPGASSSVDFQNLANEVHFEKRVKGLKSQESFDLDEVTVDGSRSVIKRSRIKRFLDGEVSSEILSRRFKSELEERVVQTLGTPELEIPSAHIEAVQELILKSQSWEEVRNAGLLRLKVEVPFSDDELEDALGKVAQRFRVAVGRPLDDDRLYMISGRGSQKTMIFMGQEFYDALLGRF